MDSYHVNTELMLKNWEKIYFPMSNAGDLSGLKNTTLIFLFP